MREIKFRAWDKIQQKMINNTYAVFDLLAKSENIVPMQFTGLTDRHGKEIYEGDIVQWMSCEFVGEKPHDEHDASCQADGGVISYDDSRALFVVDGEYQLPYNRPLTIIGNIYENPELL